MEKIDLSNYRAVILAGGKGTRLYPVTKEIPKPLLPVNRKPIINHLVDLFSAQGISNVAVLISKQFREDFEWWKKRYYPDKNISFFGEAEPLGTFGGISLLKSWLSGKSFFLTNGDELKEINLFEMAEFHERMNSVGTIALVEVPNPQDYGIAVCEGNLIKEFIEKSANPPSNYINSGLYLLSSEVLHYQSEPKFAMIEKDIFPLLARENKLAGFKFKGKWTDCGTWARYESAIEQWENDK